MKLRILFVDDEPHLREFMRSELPRLGHEITVCPNAQAGPPGIIFFDISYR